ncbi:MAG: F0F1 ATP synthase subunit A [Capsulimonadaceae bacterium]
MELLSPWVYLAYIVICSALLIICGAAIVARPKKVPGRVQNFVEWISEGLRGQFLNGLGPGGEKHLPLIFGLFWYIVFCNLIELVPIFKATTSNPSDTIGLGLIVFVYVQAVGIRSKGLWSYLKHFKGPTITPFLLGLVMACLFIPIEVIGEIIKPFTLGMRLFGNIYAEDIMHEMAAKLDLNYFVPVAQVLICALQVFTGLIQAYIFSLLSCAYIGLMSETHDDHGHAPDSHATPAAA